MDNTNIEQLINNSFLARVPALVEGGLTIDEAIKQAFEDDLIFNCELQNGRTERSKKARQILCNRSYTTHRVREEIRGFETRAEAMAVQA